MTPVRLLKSRPQVLWIAFRLYLWGIGDTAKSSIATAQVVVNCFQIVSLRYWWHPSALVAALPPGCELLSDCIFEVLVTPLSAQRIQQYQLWIAFRLYLWGIGDTLILVREFFNIVVNCFQIVSLRYWWHLILLFDCWLQVVNCFQIVSLRYWWHLFTWVYDFVFRCELLSDCIFEVLVTPKFINLKI